MALQGDCARPECKRASASRACSPDIEWWCVAQSALPSPRLLGTFGIPVGAPRQNKREKLVASLVGQSAWARLSGAGHQCMICAAEMLAIFRSAPASREPAHMRACVCDRPPLQRKSDFLPHPTQASSIVHIHTGEGGGQHCLRGGGSLSFFQRVHNAGMNNCFPRIIFTAHIVSARANLQPAHDMPI